MTYSIRTAQVEDLPHIQAIFNEEILHGLATWQYEACDLNYYREFFDYLKKQQFPLLIAEECISQEIIGYAYYSSFRSIAGFHATVEHSIFIKPQYGRQGIGQHLLQTLIDLARQQKRHIMVGAIDHENLASIHLHQKLGFVQTGYMPQVGQKFNQWRDLVLMQLNLEESLF